MSVSGLREQASKGERVWLVGLAGFFWLDGWLVVDEVKCEDSHRQRHTCKWHNKILSHFIYIPHTNKQTFTQRVRHTQHQTQVMLTIKIRHQKNQEKI